ncbi:MAG: hypothetical protein E6J71_25785, partial [Deltaproteobacteria bacterium]
MLARPMPPDPVGQDERFRAWPPRSRGLRARRGACFSPRMNHALVFEALAAAYPDRECIVTPTRRLSYAQVADHMRRLASVLHAHGLGCRRERTELANHESGQDHVGFYLLNCPEYI